ncbi:MAG TPA: beta-L-arabinofuranosidase domain-containing protein, partial [Methylomirabilota bacterium]|nr:beta-L-arabinofuranosidase domain-containing protein [Methylomirabilota bacterium]
RYFQWLSTQPDENFGAGYWPKTRFGDNIETLFWLYNRTGETRWLDLAKRMHEHMQDWTTGVHDWHNVNIAQGFREPGIYFQLSRDPRLLGAAEHNHQTVLDLYGQFPGGGFGGDENCRPGYTDPRQGFETCGIVEFMHSFELLTRVSANPLWADRCEELAFNSLPAALTPNLKALHYLTCANQVQLDRSNKAPGIQNSGTMFSYSPLEVYRCCQHNVSHGWPFYAEELWLATPDRGLCASLYSACDVSARAGDGSPIKISEKTDYPFSETISFQISVDHPVSFPLYLRVPQWCENPSLQINGLPVPLKGRPATYLAVTCTWQKGDIATLQLPMKTAVRKWPKNNNAVSVHYGPLAFSLKIKERWNRYGGTDLWPESEVFPDSPWNYGLVLPDQNPEASLRLVRRAGAILAQPFTPESAPLEFRVQAKKFPPGSPTPAAWSASSNPARPNPANRSRPLPWSLWAPPGSASLLFRSLAPTPTPGSGLSPGLPPFPPLTALKAIPSRP